MQHSNLYFEHKQYLIQLTFWNYVTYEFGNPESFLHKMVLGLISKQLLHPFHVYGHIMLKAPVLVRSLLSTDVCE